MSRQKVINNTFEPHMLDSGQQLAAAGTRGSVREDVTLSELDRSRLVATGKVSVITIEDEPTVEAAKPEDTASRQVSTTSKKSRT